MNAITTMPAQAIARMDFATKLQAADYLLKSGFLPKAIGTVQQVVTIMMYADELGIGYMQAMNGINVIQGKPGASPQLMLALINRSGQLENMRIDATDTGCTVMMKRVGRDPHTETFTLEDAKRFMTSEYVNGQKTSIPLSDKTNWKSQPRVMLKWRAVAACARVVFPDVIQGMYTPEELGADVAVSEDGEMTITVQPEVVPTPTPQLASAPKPAAPDEPTMEDITRSPYAGTWYDDKTQRDMYLNWLRREGLKDGQDVGLTGKQPWEYADGKAACEAVKAKLDERAGKASDAPADGTKWSLFLAACDEYALSPDRMIELLDGKTHQEFTSVPSMRAAIHKASVAHRLDFRPATMRYEQVGNGKKLVVSAPGGSFGAGTMTIFGGREQLKNLLAGDAAAASDALGMDAWQPGQAFDAKALAGLVFSWELRTKEGKQERVITKARWVPIAAAPEPAADPLALDAPQESKAAELFDALAIPS